MSDYDEDFESPTKTDASPAASPTKSEAAAADSSAQQLHVTVVRARNVPASSDVGTLPDPYCAVLVGDQRFQTEACDETTSPVWNATFEFNVADAASDKLTVRLWEDDTFSDDKLGAAVVPLSDDCFVTDEWVEKTVSIGSSGCEIDLKLKAVGFGKAAESKPEEKEAEKEAEEEAAAADTTNEASPGKESSAPRSPTPSSHRSLTPTPPSSKNSSPAASPTKSDKPADDAEEENAENENNNEAAADPAPEQAEHEEREKEKDAAAKASDDDDDDEKKDDDEQPADADNTNNDNANNSQSQSKIAQRKRLPPRSGAVATVAYPGERQVAVADILDPTKPLVKSTKPLTRPLGPSFVEETTAEERRQRRLRQKASSTERTQSIAEQRDNERRYLKAQQEFEREKRLAERAIYHRERVSQWATRLGASPLGVDLVADHERIDEEAFVRQREERRRQALAEKRKRRIKNEIIVKALAEVPLLEEARRQKREMLEEERRERAQRDVQRVEAIQARKLRDMALMKAERQSKLDQRLMNA